jgi:hypothetical protein
VSLLFAAVGCSAVVEYRVTLYFGKSAVLLIDRRGRGLGAWPGGEKETELRRLITGHGTSISL